MPHTYLLTNPRAHTTDSELALKGMKVKQTTFGDFYSVLAGIHNLRSIVG
jgi:putative component of toxin-antitoxin plasmid stabilization module